MIGGRSGKKDIEDQQAASVLHQVLHEVTEELSRHVARGINRASVLLWGCPAGLGNRCAGHADQYQKPMQINAPRNAYEDSLFGFVIRQCSRLASIILSRMASLGLGSV
jgi:hypothetical protein